MSLGNTKKDKFGQIVPSIDTNLSHISFMEETPTSRIHKLPPLPPRPGTKAGPNQSQETPSPVISEPVAVSNKQNYSYSDSSDLRQKVNESLTHTLPRSESVADFIKSGYRDRLSKFQSKVTFTETPMQLERSPQEEVLQKRIAELSSAIALKENTIEHLRNLNRKSLDDFEINKSQVTQLRLTIEDLSHKLNKANQIFKESSIQFESQKALYQHEISKLTGALKERDAEFEALKEERVWLRNTLSKSSSAAPFNFEAADPMAPHPFITQESVNFGGPESEDFNILLKEKEKLLSEMSELFQSLSAKDAQALALKEENLRLHEKVTQLKIEEARLVAKQAEMQKDFSARIEEAVQEALRVESEKQGRSEGVLRAERALAAKEAEMIKAVQEAERKLAAKEAEMVEAAQEAERKLAAKEAEMANAAKEAEKAMASKATEMLISTKEAEKAFAAKEKDLRMWQERLYQREKVLQNYTAALTQEKQEIKEHIQMISDEIRAAHKLHPLKDYLALTEMELSKLELQLKKTPVISPERASLVGVLGQMIKQRDFLKSVLSASQQQLEERAQEVLLSIQSGKLEPIPPVPPKE